MQDKKLLPLIMVFVGIVLIFISQAPSITGAFIAPANDNPVSGTIIGSLILLFGLGIFGRPLARYIPYIQKKKKQQPQIGPVWKPGQVSLTSQIKRDSGLVKIAKEAMENRIIQQEMTHLTEELAKGHLEAGLGRLGHVDGTDISYLRGRNGARLFFHRVGSGYEIVGKSSHDKSEDQVINKLKILYKR